MLLPLDDRRVVERAAYLLEAGVALDTMSAQALARDPANWPEGDDAAGGGTL